MDDEGRRALPRTGYPRRRAVTACLTCRERKRKCDNSRPTCSFCQQIGSQCHYDGRDASSFDNASLAILDRLSVLESLLRQIPTTSQARSPSPRLQESRPIVSPNFMHFDRYSENRLSLRNATVWSVNLDANCTMGTDKILQWPIFQENLSYLPRFTFLDFHGLETYTYLDDAFNRSEPRSSDIVCQNTSINISTERGDIELLVDRFFKRVHTKNPILDRQTVKQYCHRYYEHGPSFDLETCLLLIICALGAQATEYPPHELTMNDHDNFFENSTRLDNLRLAKCYFGAAEKRLGTAMTSSSALAIQCLCLAGIYHMYTLNPMAALRMFHTAGSSLQLFVATGVDSFEGTLQRNSSLFWACYKSEREILAEMPLLQPALGELGSPERYPPPPQRGFPFSPADDWVEAEEDSWYFFLSEIALRRITDKVAEMVTDQIETILSTSQDETVQDLVPIVEEFERQAYAWRDHLPSNIRFPDVPQLADTELKQYSRGRYYRVLELMYRPFIFAAIHVSGCRHIVQQLASKGLSNALRYLQHCHMTHRHHGRWLQLRNALKATCLLLASSKSRLEMPDGWYEGVEKTLQMLQYWRVEFPSCQSYMDVILAMDTYSKRANVIETP